MQWINQKSQQIDFMVPICKFMQGNVHQERSKNVLRVELKLRLITSIACKGPGRWNPLVQGWLRNIINKYIYKTFSRTCYVNYYIVARNVMCQYFVPQHRPSKTSKPKPEMIGWHSSQPLQTTMSIQTNRIMMICMQQPTNQ